MLFIIFPPSNIFISINIVQHAVSGFQILRVVPNKLLGIALQTLVPLGLMLVPFIESFNKFQNPFRRPVAMTVFLTGTLVTIYLGIGAALPIDKSLTLGLF